MLKRNRKEIHTCLIGGAGFIGRHLVPHLIKAGREVTVIGRKPKLISLLPATVRYLSYKNIVEDTLSEMLDGCDEIVDLAYATVPKTSYTDPIFDIQANLPFAVRLFNAAMEVNVQRMIFLSSGGTVYGASKEIPISESHPTMPFSPYGITKLTIEKYAFMFHQCYGLPIILIRPANAYGPGAIPCSGQGFIATAIAKIAAGEEVHVFGDRGTIRDYVHVSDIVSGIMAALQRGRIGEIYNIGTGIGHDNIQVLETICNVSNIPYSTICIKKLSARPFDVPINILDSKKLRKQTGWEPQISLSKGIADYWDAVTQKKSYT